MPFNGTAAAHSRQRRRHVLAQRLRRPGARAQQVSRRATVADTPRRCCCNRRLSHLLRRSQVCAATTRNELHADGAWHQRYCDSRARGRDRVKGALQYSFNSPYNNTHECACLMSSHALSSSCRRSSWPKEHAPAVHRSCSHSHILPHKRPAALPTGWRLSCHLWTSGAAPRAGQEQGLCQPSRSLHWWAAEAVQHLSTAHCPKDSQMTNVCAADLRYPRCNSNTDIQALLQTYGCPRSCTAP